MIGTVGLVLQPCFLHVEGGKNERTGEGRGQVAQDFVHRYSDFGRAAADCQDTSTEFA